MNKIYNNESSLVAHSLQNEQKKKMEKNINSLSFIPIKNLSLIK